MVQYLRSEENNHNLKFKAMGYYQTIHCYLAENKYITISGRVTLHLLYAKNHAQSKR